MANLAPATLVPGAPRVQLPFGLFSVVDFRNDSNASHWEAGGVQWEYIDPFTTTVLGQAQWSEDSGDYADGLPFTFDDSGVYDSGDSGATPLDAADPGFTSATLFTAAGLFKVSPAAWPPEAAQERATDVLVAFEERQVEHTIWSGLVGATPNLDTPDNLGSWDIEDAHIALGRLEHYIADTYGSLGVMHMNRMYALTLLHNNTLITKGNSLQTSLGTPVIAGAGYPIGAIRATPAIFGYRSDIFYPSNRPGDLLDRSRNDMYAVAERNYLLGFDPTGVGEATITETA